jgi:hypothetical protein
MGLIFLLWGQTLEKKKEELQKEKKVTQVRNGKEQKKCEEHRI